MGLLSRVRRLRRRLVIRGDWLRGFSLSNSRSLSLFLTLSHSCQFMVMIGSGGIVLFPSKWRVSLMDEGCIGRGIWLLSWTSFLR